MKYRRRNFERKPYANTFLFQRNGQKERRKEMKKKHKLKEKKRTKNE